MTTKDSGKNLLPERLAAKLWRSRRGTVLRSLDGKALRVLYPGRPNGGPGPDFRDALVQPEDSPPLRGDVEVHREAAGWREHGHHQDPRYNGVVLQVVYAPGPAASQHTRSTRRQDGQGVPTALLSLVPPVPGSEGDATGAGVGGWLEERLATLRVLSLEELQKSLTEAGEERFLERSAALRLALSHKGPDQALYRGLMEALGYSRNRLPFLELAHRAPWGVVKATAAASDDPGRATEAIERLLIGASGLGGPSVQRQGGPGAGIAPLSPSAWCLAGLRPQNHPRRRIAGAAALFAPMTGIGPTGYLAQILRTGQGGKAGPLVKALEASRGGETLIGRDRALDMAVNVALPFFHAWSALQGNVSLARASLEVYRTTPKLSENEVTREMAYLLGAPIAGLARGACQQQGLIHLYQRLLGKGDALHYEASATGPGSLHSSHARYAPLTAEEKAA